MTVESFDGTTVRGTFSGTIDPYQSCDQTGACVDAPGLGTVSGEGTFALPPS